MTDADYMRMAIELASKGNGYVSPNPLVGAVIVKEDRIIGKGYHERFGGLHAERNALANCTEDPRGASLYVTLEPCCHYGKTPPCTEAIISSGISKVYVGIMDPNPLVAGKGIAILRNNGIAVQVGLLEEECRSQNKIFLHYIQNRTPYVAFKYAMTLDGKIATVTGASRWITNEKSREYVHNLRGTYTAIMVGIGTVLADDPMLNCRLVEGRDPIRIVCDSHLRIPINSRIVTTAGNIRTIIATCESDSSKTRPLVEKGCEILEVPKDSNGSVDLPVLMSRLGELNIDSVMIEGGSSLGFAALKSQIINKIYAFIAPKIFGGDSARTPIGGAGFRQVDNGIQLVNQQISYFDRDILVESEVTYSCSQV